MAHGDGYSYPSVTTVLGELRKHGLEWWFKNNTAQFCDEESAKGKATGSDIHTLIEKSINGEEMTLDTEYPDDVTNAVKSFMLFKSENPQYKLKLSEITLNIEEHGYSGKLDCIADEDDNEIIVDWKSAKSKKGKLKFYPEMSAQVSAYSKGYTIQYKKPIKKAIVVLLDKTSVKYAIKELNEKEIEDNFENMFLPCVKIYKHLHKKKEKKK